MNVERAAFWCLLLSVLLHAALVTLGAGAISLPTPVVMGGEVPAADPWTGETFDIDMGPPGVGGPAALPPHAAAQPPLAPAPPDPPVNVDEPASPPDPPVKADEPASSPDPPVKADEPPSPGPPVTPTSSKSPQDPAPSVPKPAPVSSVSPRPTTSAHATPSAPASALAGSSASSSNESPGRAPGSFGASGNRRGVRNLATAFARALPIANSGDPVWTTMPLGPAGSLEVTLEVDAAGKIVGAKPTDAARAPQHLVRLVERTLTLLRAGRFSLSTVDTNAGSETFRLKVSIDQVEAAPAEDRSTAGPYGLGFKAPRPGVAGHATFTLQTGRRITIAIELVADGSGQPADR